MSIERGPREEEQDTIAPAERELERIWKDSEGIRNKAREEVIVLRTTRMKPEVLNKKLEELKPVYRSQLESALGGRENLINMSLEQIFAPLGGEEISQ